MKILIEISGGNIQRIFATETCNIVIIDHDNADAGDDPIVETFPDKTISDGKFYLEYTDASDFREVEIHDKLKRIKF